MTIFAAFFLVTFLAVASFGAHVFGGYDLQSGKDITILRDDEKSTVLIFMSAKCPCSISHAGEIAALAKDFPEFRFVGVNANADEAKEMATKYFATFPFPVLKDEKSLLAIEFGALKTPHAFVLDTSGKRVFQGGVSSSSAFARAEHKYLREALEDLKAKREIRNPVARALGCTIERP